MVTSNTSSRARQTMTPYTTPSPSASRSSAATAYSEGTVTRRPDSEEATNRPEAIDLALSQHPILSSRVRNVEGCTSYLGHLVVSSPATPSTTFQRDQRRNTASAANAPKLSWPSTTSGEILTASLPRESGTNNGVVVGRQFIGTVRRRRTDRYPDLPTRQ